MRANKQSMRSPASPAVLKQILRSSASPAVLKQSMRSSASPAVLKRSLRSVAKATNLESRTKNVRLSKNIIPLRYKIHFEPDLENFVFSGEEEIELEIEKETSFITLHSAEIEILEIALVQGKDSQTGKTSYKEKEEQVVISFSNKIEKGKAVLKLKFTGLINDKMRGFYRSRYVHEGKEYHMGTTQFESTDARRAFPCIDEPARKAIFNVSFRIPEDRVVISNMLEEEVTEHKGGYKIVRFSKSPVMSTYLLAFIIGHFEHIKNKTRDGIIVRVFVTPGKTKQAKFALDVAVRCLEFYSNYFGIKYPLPTLDLIAIPDFAAGAMENWGAVTYRETALLVDPDNSSTHNKQWVVLVIAHELAHQWFGNLVTMEWWTHLWLNEGFASYMEYLAVDSIFPEWKLWSQFVYQDHGVALDLDGLASTHAIEIDVNHPAEISEIFDAVSYSKGASIIRMLAEYLGHEEFRDGLRVYLKKHSYSNAETIDLWDALEKVSKKPVKKMMQNWTRKPGYPLVSVIVSDNKLQLFQQRFFSSINSRKKIKDNTIWMTPVSIISSKSKKEEKILLNKKTAHIVHPRDVHENAWIKLNKNETGFFRTKYSPELLKALETPIKEKKLSEEDRFGIIRDTFVLSEAGYLSTDFALKLALSYKNEDNYIVWTEIASELYKIKNLIAGTELEKKLEDFTVNLFKEIGRKVGWEKKKNEDHLDTLLRSIVLGVLGRNGEKETIKKALELFRLDKSEEKKLESDIKGVVYALVAENGGTAEFELFMKRYKQENFQEEKDRILKALCSFKDKKLLERTLDFVFSKDVKAQDSFKGVALIWGNSSGRDLAWRKVKKEWGSIEKKYSGGHLYNRFIKPAANFTSEKDAKDIESFFKKHDKTGIGRTIEQALEQIRSNATWLKRDKKKIQDLLEIQ